MALYLAYLLTSCLALRLAYVLKLSSILSSISSGILTGSLSGISSDLLPSILTCISHGVQVHGKLQRESITTAPIPGIQLFHALGHSDWQIHHASTPRGLQPWSGRPKGLGRLEFWVTTLSKIIEEDGMPKSTG